MNRLMRIALLITGTLIAFAPVHAGAGQGMIKKRVLSSDQGKKFIEQARAAVKKAFEENNIPFNGEFRKELQAKLQQLRKAGEQTPVGLNNRYASAWRRLSLAEILERIKPRIKARIEAFKGMSSEEKQDAIRRARIRIMERIEAAICNAGARRKAS